MTGARRRALQVLVDHGTARISNATAPPELLRRKGPRVYWQTAGDLCYDGLVERTSDGGETIRLTAAGTAIAAEHGIVPSVALNGPA